MVCAMRGPTPRTPCNWAEFAWLTSTACAGIPIPIPAAMATTPAWRVSCLREARAKGNCQLPGGRVESGAATVLCRNGFIRAPDIETTRHNPDGPVRRGDILSEGGTRHPDTAGKGPCAALRSPVTSHQSTSQPVNQSPITNHQSSTAYYRSLITAYRAPPGITLTVQAALACNARTYSETPVCTSRIAFVNPATRSAVTSAWV